MDARSVFSGGTDGRFERVVYGAVVEGRLTPEGLGADVIVGRLVEDGRRVVVLRGGSAAARDLVRFTAGAGHTEVLWVGGGAGDVPELERALAHALGPDGGGWLVTDDGAIVPIGGSPPAGPALTLVDDAAPDWERFWSVLDAGRAPAEPPPELRAFVQAYQSRRPRVTQALLVVIVAVYGFGALFGAPDFSPALSRMGALEKDRVLDGEVWRLVSCTFLHGSLPHILANSYVLWALGSQLERIVGSARFLVLYGVSGIGGSLLSLAFMGTAGSVGASGAIWGLMTAMLVLTLRPGVLPDPIRSKARSGLLQTVLINVAISFVPGVDWAGHAGGGLAGAAFAASGLLTRGMPRWDRAEPEKVPAYVRLGAPIAAVVLAAGLVTAVLVGRPWELDAAPRLVPVTVGDLTLAAPAGLTTTATAEGADLGDLSIDPAQLTVTYSAFEGREEAVRQADTELRTPVEGFSLRGGVTRDTVGDATVLEARLRGDRLWVSRVVVVRDDSVVWVEAVVWKQVAEAWKDVAREVGVSARAGPP